AANSVVNRLLIFLMSTRISRCLLQPVLQADQQVRSTRIDGCVGSMYRQYFVALPRSSLAGKLRFSSCSSCLGLQAPHSLSLVIMQFPPLRATQQRYPPLCEGSQNTQRTGRCVPTVLI